MVSLQTKIVKIIQRVLYTESFSFNPFQENTYLIYNDTKECWIVDPGMYEPREIAQFTTYIEQNGLQPQAIINTHAHLDHIFGIQALKDRYGIPFYLHAKDLPVLQNARASAMMFGFDIGNPPTQDGFITEGQPLPLGQDSLEVRFAPGHSPGSIIFYYAAGNWAIAGDVIFNGSIGRTDLPGGDHNTLIASIEREVYTLPDATTIYSGHGPATTVGHEKRHNPFVRG